MSLHDKLKNLLKRLKDENSLIKAAKKIRQKDLQEIGRQRMVWSDESLDPQERLMALRRWSILRGEGDPGDHGAAQKLNLNQNKVTPQTSDEEQTKPESNDLASLAADAKIHNERRADQKLAETAAQQPKALKDFKEDHKRANKLIPDQLKALESAMAQISDPKQKEHLQALYDRFAGMKEQPAQSPVATSSQQTIKELQRHADRATRREANPWVEEEVQAEREKAAAKPKTKVGPLRDTADVVARGPSLTAAQQEAAQKAQKEANFKTVMNRVNGLIEDGDHDGAHGLFSKIKPEDLPKAYHGYRPEYIHYGIAPDDWSKGSDEDRQAAHEFHEGIRSGKLNTEPHHKKFAAKMNEILGPAKTIDQPQSQVDVSQQPAKKPPVA